MSAEKDNKFNFSKLSIKPRKNAMIWQGYRSLLATIFLWAICICRYLSLLQFVKECYRYIAKKTKKYTQDAYATRVNVPPMLPEIYFIVWLLVFSVLKIYDINCSAVKVIGYYYLFETFVWIIYYSIFRRFFEENYSIYHVLEYLLPLMLIFPTQALGISIIYELEVGEAILAILGNANQAIPNYINIMGILYAAIVIGLLVDRFPDEKIKKSDGYTVLIIGNGDVVTKRLFPALKRKHYSDKDIVRYDIGNNENGSDDGCLYFISNKEIIKNINSVSGEDSVVWISCPSNYHVEYLNALVLQKNKLIVCEKPICINKEELNSVCELNGSAIRNKIFYLSYYILEKALPFYYYCVGNRMYLQYLEIKGELTLIKNLLGKLNKVSVSIVEGQDNRNLDKSGGQLFETFIHNMLIASLVCGTPDKWEIKEAGNESDHITLTAACKGVYIDLNQEKNRGQCKREILLKYENGQIYMDIDQGKMTICCKDMEDVEVAIKEEYRSTQYAIQEDLVYRVASGECLSKDVDGLFHQIEVLEWLIDNKDIFSNTDNR